MSDSAATGFWTELTELTELREVVAMKIIPLLILCITLQAGAAFAYQEGNGNSPLTVDQMNGWKLAHVNRVVVLLRTADEGEHWTDVSPPALAASAKDLATDYFRERTAICPLDAQRASMAIIVKDRVMLEFTSSGGLHWAESVGPPASEGVDISFLDEKTGFILNGSGPTGRTFTREVYGTQDGGLHWAKLTSPEVREGAYYTTGISFRSPQVGWVTGGYYIGTVSPFFRTEDGGKTWSEQKLTNPPDYLGTYAHTAPPVFVGADKMHGYLPVSFSRADPPRHHAAWPQYQHEWIVYETADGGLTWHSPAASVQSMPDK